MIEDRLIKPREAAELLDVSYASLHAGVAGTGGLTRYRVGSQTRFSLREVQKLREKNWNGQKRSPIQERPCPTELI